MVSKRRISSFWSWNRENISSSSMESFSSWTVATTHYGWSCFSWTFNEIYAPASANPPAYIVLPVNHATQFDIRPATINMLPKFHGFESEQPYIHLIKFLTICQTFKNQNLNEEGVKLRLFPLSLEDHAASWLYSLTSNSITTWDQLSKKFMAKFFPVAKTEKIKDSIRNFRGRAD